MKFTIEYLNQDGGTIGESNALSKTVETKKKSDVKVAAAITPSLNNFLKNKIKDDYLFIKCNNNICEIIKKDEYTGNDFELKEITLNNIEDKLTNDPNKDKIKNKLEEEHEKLTSNGTINDQEKVNTLTKMIEKIEKLK